MYKKVIPAFKKLLIPTSKPEEKGDHSLLRLHLGCGTNHLAGWVNIDISENSKADRVMDFQTVKNHFKKQSVSEVMMIHSISYLRLWEARDFFLDIFSLLSDNGKLTLEFPDIVKCSKVIAGENKIENYLEAVRAFYAFDMGQIKNRDNYQPYAFGWSAWHITRELKKTGFSKIIVKDPQTHGPILWRDTRIEAIK